MQVIREYKKFSATAKYMVSLVLLLHREVALQLLLKSVSLCVCRCTTRPILHLPGYHVCKCMLFTSRFISVNNKMLIKA